MPRRGENIYKRKDGRWEGRCIKEHVNGHAKYTYIYARTYKEVKEKIHDLRLDRTEIGENKKKTSEHIDDDIRHCAVLNNIAMEWFEYSVPQLRKSSVDKYANILKNYILPHFGPMLLETISRDNVISFTNELLTSDGKNGDGLSPKTVAGILSVLQSIFRYASHCKGLSVADITRLPIKQYQKPYRVFSLFEQQVLCRYLYDKHDLIALGILVCLYTGIRIGELCALTWADVLLNEHTIYIHKTLQRVQNNSESSAKTQIVISTPKTQCSIRKIPVPDQLFKLLAEKKGTSNSFLLSGDESHYIEPRMMQYHFKIILKKCGIADANFHALRHTFATRWVEMGFDIKCLSEILGHANVNITLNRYVHPSMELKQKNMNMLSELFSVK